MGTNLRDGYGICFNEWILDNNIKNEFRLLLIISSLSCNKGFCNATNTYFAELFDETEQSISTKIKKLEKYNYLDIEYEKKGCEVINRKLRLKNILTGDKKIFISTVKKNFKEINNKENNNISKDILFKESKQKKVFKPPTLEEIEQYCKERNNKINAKMFYDYFNVSGWIDSKGNKVKNWKQKIITWEKQDEKYSLNDRTIQNPIPEWFSNETLQSKSAEENNEIDEEFDEFKDFIKQFKNE